MSVGSALPVASTWFNSEPVTDRFEVLHLPGHGNAFTRERMREIIEAYLRSRRASA